MTFRVGRYIFEVGRLRSSKKKPFVRVERRNLVAYVDDRPYMTWTGKWGRPCSNVVYDTAEEAERAPSKQNIKLANRFFAWGMDAYLPTRVEHRRFNPSDTENRVLTIHP